MGVTLHTVEECEKCHVRVTECRARTWRVAREDITATVVIFVGHLLGTQK
jgi:hypothetical protein